MGFLLTRLERPWRNLEKQLEYSAAVTSTTVEMESLKVHWARFMLPDPVRAYGLHITLMV
ncbi:MAG: hypothetical protein JRN67_03385 [Nitrososphaerota archaeon]|nr:hypothetical protein [Nitrososphaerota archaeon]